MTTTAQLTAAAQAADWSSFKSLLISATPVDITAIGDDWNTVMQSIATGVNSAATPASKGLFTSAMTQFFADAGTYLTGDQVVTTLDSIAQNAQFSGVDHLSTELVSIVNTLPAAVATTITPFGTSSLADLLNDIAGNQSNSEVTATELNHVFVAVTGKFTGQIEINDLLTTADVIIQNDLNAGTDNLASVRTLFNATPIEGSGFFDIIPQLMEDLGQIAGNPSVTPAEFHSTVSAYLSHYSTHTDSFDLINTALIIVEEDNSNGTNHLDSARALFNATPSETSTPFYATSQLMDDFGQLAYNSSVSAANLRSTLNAYLSHYSTQTNSSDILDAALIIVEADNSNGTNHLDSVRALFNATPSSSSTSYFGTSQLMDDLGLLVYNPSVTAADLHSTLNAYLSHYSTQTDSFNMLNTALIIIDADNANGTNHLDSVRALFNATPSNSPYGFSATSQLLQDLAQLANDPAVTPDDLHSTFNAYVSHYGSQTSHFDLLNTALIIMSQDNAAGTDHMNSVTALLNVTPSDDVFVGEYVLTDTLSYLTQCASNSAIAPAELRSAMTAFISHYGSDLSVYDIFSAVRTIAGSDEFTGTDHMSSIRALLNASPQDASSVDSFTLAQTLNSICENVDNSSITAAELHSTVNAFLSHYGALADSQAILTSVMTVLTSDGEFETNHLDTVRALLAQPLANPPGAGDFDLQRASGLLADMADNPAVTPEELNSTFKVFVANYGSASAVSDILGDVSTIADDDFSNGTDHLSSIRTLLGAMPADKDAVTSFSLERALDSLTGYQFNSAVTANELNQTFKSYVNHYGALTDVGDILSTAYIVADDDSILGTNNMASVRTLLAAHPLNADAADSFQIAQVLQGLNENNQNSAVSEHELAQTLTKLMTVYGSQADSADLSDAIIADADVLKFEAAGAIANHLSAAQHSDVATAVNLGSSAEILTAGHDAFDGSSSDKLAVYGAAGRDVIDFSGNTDTVGRYLDGGSGADTLLGGHGDDILAGGAGSNTLTGGAGADTFRFDHANGTAIDHVTDFNAADGDRLNLHDVLQGDASLHLSDYVSLQTVGSNTIVSVDVDGAGGFVQVAQLDNTTGLDLNDLYAHGQIIV